jgi:hypothetical protein
MKELRKDHKVALKKALADAKTAADEALAAANAQSATRDDDDDDDDDAVEEEPTRARKTKKKTPIPKRKTAAAAAAAASADALTTAPNNFKRRRTDTGTSADHKDKDMHSNEAMTVQQLLGALTGAKRERKDSVQPKKKVYQRHRHHEDEDDDDDYDDANDIDASDEDSDVLYDDKPKRRARAARVTQNVYERLINKMRHQRTNSAAKVQHAQALHMQLMMNAVATASLTAFHG